VAKIQFRPTLEAAEIAQPSKRELLDFQERWMRRAGGVALLACFVVAGSIIYQRAGLSLPPSSSDAAQLSFVHAHGGRLIVSSVFQGIGFALFVAPLLFLFRSVAGRTPRVRPAFAALIVLGPIAFGAGLALSAVGSSKAADDYTRQEPAAVQHAQRQASAANAPTSAEKAGGKTGPATRATTTTATTTAGTTTVETVTATTPSGGTTTITTGPGKQLTPDQSAAVARENLADHLNRHTAILVAGGLISTIGVLAMVFGMVYTSIWSMRTGLLTRFWGALGIAFGLFLIIPLFPPIPGVVLWFAAIGLMFLGVWPRGLPPAWAAGEAIPWPRPGEEDGAAGAVPPATVEGSGREVSERPLDGEADQSQPATDPPGQTQGQRRKKRKKRR